MHENKNAVYRSDVICRASWGISTGSCPRKRLLVDKLSKWQVDRRGLIYRIGNGTCTGNCTRYTAMHGQTPTCLWCYDRPYARCGLLPQGAFMVWVNVETSPCEICTGECGSNCHCRSWEADNAQLWTCYQISEPGSVSCFTLLATF